MSWRARRRRRLSPACAVETWSDDTETGTINSNGFTFTTSNWNQNKYQVIEITGIDNDYVGCGPMRAIPCEKDCGVVVSKGEGTDRCNTDTDRDTMFQIRLTMESVDLFFDGVDTSFSVWNWTTVMANYIGIDWIKTHVV